MKKLQQQTHVNFKKLHFILFPQVDNYTFKNTRISIDSQQDSAHTIPKQNIN